MPQLSGVSLPSSGWIPACPVSCLVINLAAKREPRKRILESYSFRENLRIICFTSSFVDREKESHETLTGDANKGSVSPGTPASFWPISNRPHMFPCHKQETAQCYPSICFINGLPGCFFLYILYNNTVTSINFLPLAQLAKRRRKNPFPPLFFFFFFSVLGLFSEVYLNIKRGGMFDPSFLPYAIFALGKKKMYPYSSFLRRQWISLLCWRSSILFISASSWI